MFSSHLASMCSCSNNNGANTQPFIEDALAVKGQSNKEFMFGKISDELGEDIQNATGKEVNGYNIKLRSGRVQHIFNHHENEYGEVLRGQEPMTPERLADLPRVFDDPDSIEIVTKQGTDKPLLDSEQRQMIRFKKRVDGVYYTVTEIPKDNSHNHDLDIETFYVTKKNPSKAIDETSPYPNVRNGITQGSNLNLSPVENYASTAHEAAATLPTTGGFDASSITDAARNRNMAERQEMMVQLCEIWAQIPGAAYGRG